MAVPIGGGGGMIEFNDTTVASCGASSGSKGPDTITYTTTETGTLKIKARASAGSQGGGSGSIELVSLTIPNGSNYE